MAKVTVMFGTEPQSERTLDLAELRIGRAMDCEIVVDNLGVSRHHCSIVQQGADWVLVDKGSNNGTYVNGSKVDRHVLRHLDRVVLGKHSLVFDANAVAAGSAEDKKKAAGMGGEMTMFVDQAALAKMIKNEPTAKRMAIALDQGGRRMVLPLGKEETSLGSGDAVDLPVKGFLVKPVQAKILKTTSGHRLIGCGGWRSVRVNGHKITDAALKAGDIIVIAGRSFSYQSA